LAALAAGSVAVSVILSAFLWRSQPLGQVLFWQCVMLALAAYMASLAWFYRRRANPAGHPGLWVRRLAIAAAALGAGWGYDAVVGLRDLRRCSHAAFQRGAVRLRHRIPAPPGRGGAAALRGERDHRLRARTRFPRRLRAALGVPAPLGRQRRNPGPARRAAR